MVLSQLNVATDTYDLQFTSAGIDVLQTECKKPITVYGKAEDTDDLDWIRIGIISSGNTLIQLNLTKDLQVLLSSQAQFKAASTTTDI